MGFCEDDVNSPAGLVSDFVGRVLDEFEELTITVSALGDTALSICVLSHETGVYGVRLQDTGRLLDDGLNYRRQ